MKQTWFETDISYHATKDKLIESGKIAGDGQDYMGKFTFHFKGLQDVNYQITTKSKLSITYPEGIGYESFLKKLKPLLVKADGTPAKIINEIEFSKSKENTSTEVNPSKELCAGIFKRIVDLRSNSQLRYREDGTTYYYKNTFEIFDLIAILAGMDPLAKEEVVNTVKNSANRPREYITFHPERLFPEFVVKDSVIDKDKPIRNYLGCLTPGELDRLIGNLGRVVGEKV